jgi:hypothetical protein
MQKTAFVCLEEGNSSFLCSYYGSIPSEKTLQQHFICLYVQRISPILQPVGRFPVIENTYPQLM